MSVVEVVLHDPSSLDVVNDPAAVVVAMLDNAKALLAQASRLEDVAEWKARAVGLEGYVRQRDLGKEAELSAQEIVRRAERRIGELIREGQERGEIRRQREDAGRPQLDHCGAPIPPPSKPTPADYFGNHKERQDTYAMTDDVAPDQFEAAVAEAKAEGNLSRANVVRKVKQVTGKAPKPDPAAPRPRNITAAEIDQLREMAANGATTRQIAARLGRSEHIVKEHAGRHSIDIRADAIVGAKARRIDHNRIVQETALTLDALTSTTAMVDIGAVDPATVDKWADSMKQSLKHLNRFIKELTRE